MHYNPPLARPPAELLTEAKARELICTNTLVPAYCLLLEGWTRNRMRDVLVVPRLVGQARLDYIEHVMAGWPEMRDDHQYAPIAPY